EPTRAGELLDVAASERGSLESLQPGGGQEHVDANCDPAIARLVQCQRADDGVGNSLVVEQARELRGGMLYICVAHEEPRRMRGARPETCFCLLVEPAHASPKHTSLISRFDDEEQRCPGRRAAGPTCLA